MQQLWGAGPPWLWLISKDFGDVKIIRPFHGVKMTELSIILLWLWGWISTIMKVLFHKKSSCLFSWSFRNLHTKNLCTLLQNYFWQMNNGANRRLKGQTDLKGAKNCILFRLLFMFLSSPDCGEKMTMKLLATNKMISTRRIGVDNGDENILKSTHHSGSFFFKFGRLAPMWVIKKNAFWNKYFSTENRGSR